MYKVNFTVAIDFTASNGQPHLANSLHYRYMTGVDGKISDINVTDGLREKVKWTVRIN